MNKERMKRILKPPYLLAKGIEAKANEKISELEIKLNKNPMRPPTAKVKKSKELRKILLVAMKYDYGFKDRGLSYEYYNIYLTIQDMGFEVEFFDFLTIYQEKGKKKMNQQLIERVQELNPDFIFFSLYQEQLDKRIVKSISETTPATTFNWFSDDDWRFHIYTKYWAPCFNYCSTTIKRAVPIYQALGYTNVIRTQWAANERIYMNLNLPKKIDVSFVGQPHSNRKELVKYLEENEIDIECFGRGWKNGYVDQNRMIEIFNTSKINLNFTSNSTGAPAQVKSRFFEVTSCEGFLLSEYANSIEEYLKPGNEFEIFENKEELLDKVKKYLENETERDRIAKNGYKKTISKHTYKHRLTEIFKSIGYELE